MTAATHNFVIEQGATFRQALIWKDSDQVPVNLTGYVARMQARRSRTAEDAVVDLSSTTGGITLGGATGQITLNISAAVTETYTWPRAFYDLELVAPTGVVTRLLQGELEVSVGFTR
jgi:hypothetical protein